jgi:hypothetical protein
MHADTDRQPRAGRIRMACGAQKFETGAHRVASIVVADQAGQINPDHLVAHHLVDGRAAVGKNFRRCDVKALHQRAELGGPHLRRKPGRTAHVSIENGDFDLGAAAVISEDALALVAEMRVAAQRSAADRAHDRRGSAFERCVAQMAAGLRIRRELCGKLGDDGVR